MLPSAADPPRFSHDIDSSCSTPFVSAPSSPSHAPPSGYFYSAPASPMHFPLSQDKIKSSHPDYHEPVFLTSDSGSFEFEFSSRFSPTGFGNGSMTSADELFFNGQIRPTSHLQRPRGSAAPFLDLYGGEYANARGRDLKMRECAKYSHRKARSMSPLRSEEYEWQGFSSDTAGDRENEAKEINESAETTPSCSASSSRSSSSGRNSKKWIFLKDLLHRSMSEGRANSKHTINPLIHFNYQLLQGYDFLHLFRDEGVNVQIGGNDQWGNITAGTDLIRRILQTEGAYGLTFPHLLKSDDTKFAKSKDDAIWLSPSLLSPYQFSSISSQSPMPM